MNAPQIIMTCDICVALLVSVIIHGRKRKGEHNFYIAFFTLIIHQAVLYWGGFWNFN